MIIHVRLRPGQDDDIAAWYEAQGDKSQAIRQAIRFYLQSPTENNLEATIQQAVAHLPALVAAAVREAMTAYQLIPAGTGRLTADEDPQQAARLDEQLNAFFDQ